MAVTPLCHEFVFAAYGTVGQATPPPGNGTRQTVTQIDLGPRTGRSGETAAVGEQRTNLRGCRPHPWRVVLDGLVFTPRKIDNHLDHFGDGDGPPTAGVVSTTVFDAGRSSNREESGNGVLDEREIAHGRDIANPNGRARAV